MEILAVGPYAVVIEWGTPESDGGSPLTGYTIAIRDTRKTMWMEVGRVKADVQKLTIKDLQVSSKIVEALLCYMFILIIVFMGY